MTTPDERAFITFTRGQIRDDALALFRNGLRTLINGDTGLPFTEDEIRFSTQPGSRIYLKLDAIDLLGQSNQQRARFTAQNADPRISASTWLRSVWVPLWLPEGILGATSSEGVVSWPAPIGTTFVGSTTLGDPTAFTARDPAGNLYQAKITIGPTLIDTATIPMIAVNGGPANPKVDDVFTASTNKPPGADPTGVAIDADFSGGFAAESDADIVARLVDVMRFRPGSGNNPQFRAWARAANTGVENAWVYSTALGANTVIVGFTSKRGSTLGPLARVATPLLLAKVRAYLTPPGSPVVPGRPFVLVQTIVPDPVDVSMTLSMRKATPGGWFDAVPWPSVTAIGATSVTGFSRITSLVSQTSFFINSAASLPNGAGALSGSNAPSLMVWNPLISNFERLQINTITDVTGGIFQVDLFSPPGFMVDVDTVICPFTELGIGHNTTDLGLIPKSAETYFDSLGPGELFNLQTDPRGAWAFRFPEPNVESPAEAGQSIVTTFFDELGQALAGAQVLFISHTVPQLPTDLSTQGPSTITLNNFGVYSP